MITDAGQRTRSTVERTIIEHGALQNVAVDCATPDWTTRVDGDEVVWCDKDHDGVEGVDIQQILVNQLTSNILSWL